MGTYDDIQVPISGQPASSSLFGDKVREAIIDLDRRVLVQEVSQQKILARRRRLTEKTNIGGTELGVCRLDDVPVLAGYMYRVSTSPLALDNVNAGMTGEIGEIRSRVQWSATAPGTPAITTSAFLGRARQSIVEAAWGPAFSLNVFYYCDADGFASFLLSTLRVAGSNPLRILGDGSNPIDFTIEFAGEDPGNGGIDL